MYASLWVEILGPISGIGISLATVLLTKAKDSGAQSVTINSLSADLGAVKLCTADHESTLATHSILHATSAKMQDDLAGRLRLVEERQNQAIGREEARTHTKRV